MDIQSIYDRCMQTSGDFRLTPRDVSMAHDSPFALYCKYHVDPVEKEPPDMYVKHLFERGIEHKKSVLKSDYHRLKPVPEDDFMHVLYSMAAGDEAIVQAPLFCPLYYGRADILERRKGISAFGDYHYVVREIELAKNIKDKHIIKAGIYAVMLGEIQQRLPGTFLITNAYRTTTSYQYAEYKDVIQETVETACRIYNGWKPPAVYGSKQCGWERYCNDTAIRNNDVSLIPGIGGALRQSMVQAGFDTVQSVAESTTTKLQQIKKIGAKTAVEFLTSAQAITAGTHIRRSGTVNLPDKAVQIFLDFEGLDKEADDTIQNYLIGALVRIDGKEKYHPFVAKDRREDLMLKSFLEFLSNMDDYVIYHWGDHERIQLRDMMERHDIQAHYILEPDTLIDLYSICTGAFAFPTYSNKIKDVAKWMGFEWRHKDVDAMTSAVLYQSYVSDPVANQDKFQKVLDYNEDDCIATRVVHDWLVDESRN